MPQHKIAYIALAEPDTTLAEQGLAGLDYEMNAHFCSSDGETIEAIKGVEVIIDAGVPMPRHIIEQIDTAKAIVSLGHGFDRVDHNAATDKGVMVVNCAGFCTDEVADHSIMLLLACAKNLTRFHDIVRSGGWDKNVRSRVPPMQRIDGQVLGLIGLGNIGRATARRAHAFGLNVIAYDPYVAPWTAKECDAELVHDLRELASRSDYVSMHVPLNDETRKLVGESVFKAMKPTAYFINTCRGQTVDERALIRALEDGEIAGAGLDVFEEEPTPADNPLLKMDNVIVTPHTAGTSSASVQAGLLRLGEETARILRGAWPMSLVNPEVRAKLPMRAEAVNR